MNIEITAFIIGLAIVGLVAVSVWDIAAGWEGFINRK